MRFQVPQFTDIEDKIIGPLTLKQFLYIGGGAGMSVVFYTFLPKFLAFIFIVPTFIFALALAFYKVNNRPFIAMVEAFFRYVIAEKLYIWRHDTKAPEAWKPASPQAPSEIPTLSGSKLKDMHWQIDVRKKDSEAEAE